MPKAYYNLRVEQNVDISWAFNWKPGGTTADLSGWTASMKVRAAEETTAAVILTLTHASGIALAATDPNVTVTLTAAQTLALPKGIYFYDLLLISPGGTKSKLLKGTFEVDFTDSQ